MEVTSPKKLRAELKDYLDLASTEPIRIQRRSGDSYILVKEDSYLELQNEISSLQRRLLSMASILDGDVEEFNPEDTALRLKRFSK